MRTTSAINTTVTTSPTGTTSAIHTTGTTDRPSIETSIEKTDGGLSKDNGQHCSTVRTGQNYQTHLNIIAMLATRNNSERCMYRNSNILCGYLDTSYACAQTTSLYQNTFWHVVVAVRGNPTIPHQQKKHDVQEACMQLLMEKQLWM